MNGAGSAAAAGVAFVAPGEEKLKTNQQGFQGNWKDLKGKQAAAAGFGQDYLWLDMVSVKFKFN